MNPISKDLQSTWTVECGDRFFCYKSTSPDGANLLILQVIWRLASCRWWKEYTPGKSISHQHKRKQKHFPATFAANMFGCSLEGNLNISTSLTPKNNNYINYTP